MTRSAPRAAAISSVARPRAQTMALAAGGLVVAGALTGCAGTGPAPAPGPTTAPTTATTPSVQQVTTADQDLHDARCRHGDDGWSFTGQVTNSSQQTANYTVTVRIAPSTNAKQTVGLTTVTKTVAAGKTVPFVAKNFSVLAAKGHVCRTLTTRA